LPDPGGPALGIEAEIEYEGLRISLEPGNTVLCMTDGVVEAQGPDGEFYGTDRLMKTLENLSGADPRLLCQGLAAELRAFEQEGRYDDITLIALQRSLVADLEEIINRR